jgi:hypothetical protein
MSLPYPIERQREAERKWRRRIEQAARTSRARENRLALGRDVAPCPSCGTPSPLPVASTAGGIRLRQCTCIACGYIWPGGVQWAS